MWRVFASTIAVAAMLGLASNALAFEINIDIAPSVVSLDSQGQIVTVHTDIAYGAVVGGSVFLDTVEIAWWKSDLQGNFVAKFNLDDVKDLLRSKVGTEVKVTLSGETIGGQAFFGTDTIKVVQPRK